MKGRTFADQNRMRIGGITKMNVGGSLVDRAKTAIAANKAAKASAPPKAAPSMPAPGRGTLIDRAKRVITDRGPVKPRAQAIMPVPGMKVGGVTKMNTGGSLASRVSAQNAKAAASRAATVAAGSREARPIEVKPSAAFMAREARRAEATAAQNAKKAARDAAVAAKKPNRSLVAMPAAGMKIGGRTYGRGGKR